MADGTWNTQSMAKGVNQGCPLSSILAALVLHEVLAPIDAKLKIRAANRRQQQNTGDDDAGGETHPMAYIDDAGAAVPHEDVEFFFDEFTKLGPQFGCHLNTVKTRIMTSTTPPFLSSTQYQRFLSPAPRPNSHPLNPIMDSSQRHPSAKPSFQPPPLLVSPPELPTIKLLPNGNRHRNSSSRPTTWVPILRQVLLCPTSPGEHGRCNKAPRNCL